MTELLDHTPSAETEGTPLLEVNNLVVRFPVRTPGQPRGWVHAVEDVSFAIERGQTVGLVGESGSGKSTVGNALLRLVPITSGELRLGGEDMLAARGKGLRDIRRRVAMVFQDPLAALDPRSTVGESIEEPLRIHRIGGRAERVTNLMDLVGLPSRFMDRFPHELSGGSACVSPVRSRPAPNCWCWMRRPPRWTCPCRRRS